MSASPAKAASLELVHHHPGRLRLRSEAFQDSGAAAEHAREALMATGAVLSMAHDALTGSLLIEYEPGRIEPDALLERVARAAALCPAGGRCRPERPAGERFVRTCRSLNDAAYEMTGFRVEPRVFVPIAVAAASLAVFAVSKGQRLPRWDNLAYWSLSLFAMLHGRDIDTSAGGK